MVIKNLENNNRFSLKSMVGYVNVVSVKMGLVRADIVKIEDGIVAFEAEYQL